MTHLAGNQRAYATFASWIQGERFPHAILLEGPSGCGKTHFAMELAQAVVCERFSASSDEDLPVLGGFEPVSKECPCGFCRHCVKAEKNIHPDILLFEGEGRARSFHIGTVRELRSQAFVYPNEANAKVFVLRNVQDMSVQAQNALLKILEEPPASVIFILTCENKSMLLDTILSRVSVLTLELPTVEQCEAVLLERTPEAEPDAARQAAQGAGGNVGKALALLSGEGEDCSSEASELWAHLKARRELEALALLFHFDRNRKGFIELLELFRGLLEQEILTPISHSSSSYSAISALQLMDIVDIIDDIAASAAGNGNISLLGNVLCARVIEVLTIK